MLGDILGYAVWGGRLPQADREYGWDNFLNEIGVICCMKSPSDRHWWEVNSRYFIANVTMVYQFLEQQWQHQQNPDGVSLSDSRLYLEFPEISPPIALEQIYRTFNFSTFEIYLLLMGAGMALFPKVSSLCANLHQNPQQAYPTFGLGLQYLPNAYWSAFAPNAALRRWQLLQVGTGTVLTQCPLQIDECILHYLMGESYYDDRLSHLLKPLSDRDADPLPPSHDRVVRELVEIWETPDPLCDSVRVQLTGWESNDKSAIVAAAGDRLNRPVKVLLCDRLPTDQENITFIIKRWQREYTLTQSFLLLDCDALNLSDPTKRATVLQLIDDLNTPFAIATRERIYHSRSPLRTFEIAPLTYQEKLELWQTHLGETAVTLNGRVETIVAQFNLSQTSIKTACQSLRKSTIHSLSSDEVNDAEDPDIESDRLWNICRTMARSRLDDMARRIETKATWDDLILPEKQLKTLQEIAAQFRQQAKVIQEWGFSRKNSRGLGMTSLFSGPSGTGKTTAAEVLAREFNLDLYRIDLSSVVSKYIGETEKNLRRIFDAAESGSAVLLFDEADALFGKRTEVKDSRDRHANVEVSYLLQRMEAYQGLAILTTNLKKALDQAFLRRIRFIVSFPFPNNQARGEIWARIFPAETPTQGLDPKKLASLSLSGGNIANIALNAAFLAADSGEPVMMKHILAASRSECAKIEKPWVESEVRGWV